MNSVSGVGRYGMNFQCTESMAFFSSHASVERITLTRAAVDRERKSPAEIDPNETLKGKENFAGLIAECAWLW